MNIQTSLLLFSMVAAAGCATSSNLTKESGTDGILRVTNHARESVQVFETTATGETFLRLIQPGNSESFHVAGKLPGDTISLRAKTASGREYTSGQPLTLAAQSCTRNYGAPTATPGCEWTVP